MDYELADIKRIRKKLNLTQTEFAKKAGVSQSLIAKLESGVLDPSYSVAKQLFATLDSLQSTIEPTAQELMIKHLYFLDVKSTISEAVVLMRKHAISQLLVFRKEKLVGLVTESALLGAFTKVSSHTKQAIFVEEIMEDVPPTVTKTTPLHIVLSLLKNFPIVVVSEHGTVLGVITKSDVLKKLS